MLKNTKNCDKPDIQRKEKIKVSVVKMTFKKLKGSIMLRQTNRVLRVDVKVTLTDNQLAMVLKEEDIFGRQ